MNPFEFWERSEQVRAEVAAATERFRPKPFYEAYAPFRKLAKVARLGLPVISVATGVTSLAVAFHPLLPYWIPCFLLGLLLLSGWEQAKALALGRTAEQYYSRSGFPFGLGMVALVFALGSMAASLHGTFEAAQLLDHSQQSVREHFSALRDSVELGYAQPIAEAGKLADNYLASNSYRGVVTYTKDGRYADQYRQLVARKLELERERDQQLQQLSTEESSALSASRTDHGRQTGVALVVVLCIELLIVIANWFLVYFDWRVGRQALLVRRYFDGQRVSLSAEELGRFLETVRPPTVVTPPLPAPNHTIGFTFGQPKPENQTMSQAAPKATTKIVTKIVGTARHCQYCGEAYTVNHAKQKYCSDQCRVVAWETKHGRRVKREFRL